VQDDDDPLSLWSGMGQPGVFGSASLPEDILSAMMELMTAHQESLGLERMPEHAHAAKRREIAPQAPEPAGPGATREQRWAALARKLEGLGAVVHLPSAAGDAQEWSGMAGYEEQKAAVEDLVLMSITHAEEYAQMAQKTRKDGKCQRPKVCGAMGPSRASLVHVRVRRLDFRLKVALATRS
jgi:hypothetical protein